MRLAASFAVATVMLFAADAFGYYHPTLGRWVQRDSTDYADGMSTYQYGRSMPPMVLDPSGDASLQWTEWQDLDLVKQEITYSEVVRRRQMSLNSRLPREECPRLGGCVFCGRVDVPFVRSKHWERTIRQVSESYDVNQRVDVFRTVTRVVYDERWKPPRTQQEYLESIKSGPRVVKSGLEQFRMRYRVVGGELVTESKVAADVVLVGASSRCLYLCDQGPLLRHVMVPGGGWMSLSVAATETEKLSLRVWIDMQRRLTFNRPNNVDPVEYDSLVGREILNANVAAIWRSSWGVPGDGPGLLDLKELPMPPLEGY